MIGGVPGESPAAMDEEAAEDQWRDDQRTISLPMGRGSVDVVVANRNGEWNLDGYS